VRTLSTCGPRSEMRWRAGDRLFAEAAQEHRKFRRRPPDLRQRGRAVADDQAVHRGPAREVAVERIDRHAALGRRVDHAADREVARKLQDHVHPGGVAEQPERRPVRARGRVRPVPARAGQAVDQDGAATGVLQAHLADMALQVARAEQGEDRVLHRLGDADAELRAQRRQLVDQLRRRDQPARAEGGGEDLRRRAQVDDDVRVHAVQGRQRADVVAELAVIVVLDDDRAGRPGPRDQCLPATDRKPPAQRVLVGGRGVEQLEIVGELLGNDAVRVDPAGHDPRPGSAQHLAAGGVAGFLDAGLVARRQEDVREQREPARHALGDQDPLRPDDKPA
jgi:hypothetical protein